MMWTIFVYHSLLQLVILFGQYDLQSFVFANRWTINEKKREITTDLIVHITPLFIKKAKENLDIETKLNEIVKRLNKYWETNNYPVFMESSCKCLPHEPFGQHIFDHLLTKKYVARKRFSFATDLKDRVLVKGSTSIQTIVFIKKQNVCYNQHQFLILLAWTESRMGKMKNEIINQFVCFLFTS